MVYTSVKIVAASISVLSPFYAGNPLVSSVDNSAAWPIVGAAL